MGFLGSSKRFLRGRPLGLRIGFFGLPFLCIFLPLTVVGVVVVLGLQLPRHRIHRRRDQTDHLTVFPGEVWLASLGARSSTL